MQSRRGGTNNKQGKVPKGAFKATVNSVKANREDLKEFFSLS